MKKREDRERKAKKMDKRMLIGLNPERKHLLLLIPMQVLNLGFFCLNNVEYIFKLTYYVIRLFVELELLFVSLIIETMLCNEFL